MLLERPFAIILCAVYLQAVSPVRTWAQQVDVEHLAAVQGVCWEPVGCAGPPVPLRGGRALRTCSCALELLTADWLHQ